MRFPLIAAALVALIPVTAAAKCGGDFKTFVNGLKKEAITLGHKRATVNRFFKSVALDPATLRRDRSQGIFKSTFTEFAGKVISKNRMDHGRKNAKKYKSVFDRAEREYGVDRSVILAFWALETDYGAFQGDFNTLNSLVTLAHDCRRPALFRPEIFAALTLYEQGDFNPATTTGAWAGEIGMVQMLPDDILNQGVDGDGDGHVRLKKSAPDAIMTAAKMLNSLGWKANEPWLFEVSVPKNLNWGKTGLAHQKKVSEWRRLGVKARHGKFPKGAYKAAILLPQGRHGPAFLALPNFPTYFEWNQSFVYVTTAAYFATRLGGAKVFSKGTPDPSLSDGEMKSLQKKLRSHGHDVGKIDGILGAKTRGAVQKEQIRLGLPADAWPTRRLLDRL